jgi:hypothetical protein
MGKLYEGAIRHRKSLEPERFDALEAAGFRVERNGNLINYVFGRYGGHYVDVGVSKMISDGLVRILRSHFFLSYYRSRLKVSKIVGLDQD